MAFGLAMVREAVHAEEERAATGQEKREDIGS